MFEYIRVSKGDPRSLEIFAVEPGAPSLFLRGAQTKMLILQLNGALDGSYGALEPQFFRLGALEPYIF